VIVILLAFLVSVRQVLGFLTDALSHPPPSSGTYGYNTFVPPNTTGATYTDPVFGSTVRRLSTDHVPDDIYARNMWWNANGTKYLHAGKVIDTSTGAETHTGIPSGSFNFDRGFDPVDPNVLYYFSGSTLRKVTLGAAGSKTDVVYFTAPAAFRSLGGTINWMDASGRYMVVRYGAEPSIYLYDRQNLAAGPYANPVSGAEVESGAYLGLTPDANFVVGGKRSWSINHSTRTVATAGTYYWDLCGDHGAFLSTSDGRNYKIVANCYDQNELWRVDITNNAAGLGAAGQKALPRNLRLLALPTWDFTMHASATAKGSYRDWGFFAIEDFSVNDAFNGPVSPWLPYKSEIIAANVLTGEIRRLAHHRSRSLPADYSYQPRLSVSWGAEFVGWASNFNQTGVVDIFATPFANGAPSTPTGLHIVP